MIERKRLVLLSLLIFGAIRIDGMPQVNIHKYEFAAGKYTMLLPKDFLLVLGGATSDKITARDAGLSGADKAID